MSFFLSLWDPYLVTPTKFVNLSINYSSNSKFLACKCVSMCIHVSEFQCSHVWAHTACKYSWWMYADRWQRHSLTHRVTRNTYGLVLHLCYMRVDHTQTFIGMNSSSFLQIHFSLPYMSCPLSNLSLSIFPSTFPPSSHVFEANGRDRFTRCSIDVDS